MKRSLIVVVAIAAFLLMGWTEGDPLERRVQILEKRLEQSGELIVSLSQRLERLETFHAHGSSSSASARSIPSSARVVQIDEIRKLPIDEEMLEEAERMKRRAMKLQADAENLEEKMSVYSAPEHSRRRATLKAMAARKYLEAKRLHKLAVNMKREANVSRQLIIGWSGTTTMFLRTKRDMSSVFAHFGTGDFVEWNGHTMTSGADFHHVLVTSLKIVRAPEGFKPRPINESVPELDEDWSNQELPGRGSDRGRIANSGSRRP